MNNYEQQKILGIEFSDSMVKFLASAGLILLGLHILKIFFKIDVIAMVTKAIGGNQASARPALRAAL